MVASSDCTLMNVDMDAYFFLVLKFLEILPCWIANYLKSTGTARPKTTLSKPLNRLKKDAAGRAIARTHSMRAIFRACRDGLAENSTIKGIKLDYLSNVGRRLCKCTIRYSSVFGITEQLSP